MAQAASVRVMCCLIVYLWGAPSNPWKYSLPKLILSKWQFTCSINNGRFLNANYVEAVTFAAGPVLSSLRPMQVQKAMTVTTGLRMRERFLQCSMETVRWPNPRAWIEVKCRERFASDQPQPRFSSERQPCSAHRARVAMNVGLEPGLTRIRAWVQPKNFWLCSR